MIDILEKIKVCNYTELEKIHDSVVKLMREKLPAYELEKENEYDKRRAQREKARIKFITLIPDIKLWLYLNLKPGDIITCKGYRRHKKVVELKGDHSVIALCGHFHRGTFIPNGSGSENTLEYVTSVLRNGKFEKIKDLI